MSCRERADSACLPSLCHSNEEEKYPPNIPEGEGIETLIHYPVPIHLQMAYKELGYRRGDLPVTEKVAHEILSLPFFPELTNEEMRQVQEQLRKFFV